METHKDVGICTPYLVRTDMRLVEHKDEDVILEDEQLIEGWAFTIRRSIIDSSGLIPFEKFSTFMGDTFLFWWAKHLNYTIKKMMNNGVFHYGGITVREIEGRIELHSKENRQWIELEKEIITREKSNIN
jgi:GT2 family glycosyltransferase